MKFLFLMMVMVGFVSTAKAQVGELPHYFSFDGYLLDGSSNPIPGPVNVTFQVYNPAGNCLVFEETHTSVTPAVDGSFNLKVGLGTRASSAVDGGVMWATIFQNTSLVRSAGSGCTGGYTPVIGDARKLRVTVGGTVLSPDYTISSVPFATTAETLQGKTASEFMLAKPYTLPAIDGSNGQSLVTDGAGNISWQTAGAGISSLNGATGPAQTFAFGSVGTAPAWSTAGAIHTLNIPSASTASVSAGLISNTDFITFTNKMPNVSGALNETLRYDGATWTPTSGLTITSGGDVSVMNTPTTGTHVATKNYVDAAVGTAVPNGSSAGQFLQWDGTSWQPMMANFLSIAGGTMSGLLDSSNRFTSSYLGSSSSPTFAINAMNGFFSPSVNTLAISAGGTERIRVDSSGNVGIGTPSPMTMLDVIGEIKATNLRLTGGGNMPGNACPMSGMIGYYAGSDKPVYCDGITWKLFNGASLPDMGSGSFANFTNSNVLVMSGPSTSITLNDVVNGGEYKLVIQGGASQTYTFTAPPCSTWKYNPPNAATTVSTDTIYKIQILNSTCYVDWKSGY